MKQHIHFSLRVLRFAAFMSVALGLAPPPAGAQSFRGREFSDWVSVWGASPGNLNTETLSPILVNGQTIREHVRLSLGGKPIRIRLSNLLGSRDLVIGAVHVALHATEASTVPGTDHAVTFSDQASITIPIGAQVVSDAIPLEVGELGEISVSIYVAPEASGVPLTFHREHSTSYISPEGDHTAEGVMSTAQTQAGLFLLSGVEVRRAAAVSVTALGDEITTGISATNKQWPDYLSERLRSNPAMAPVAVVDAAISANRLLDTIEFAPSAPSLYRVHSGPSAVARFDRDVITQAHVKWVIVFEGLNDLRPYAVWCYSGCPRRTFKEIIGAYKQLIARAHAAGLKIYGCTLTPANFTADLEQLREDVNSWIRNSGQFDSVIDFDATIRDPNQPNRILPRYALISMSPARLPNDLGYQTMANAVPLSLFSDE